MSLRRIRSDPLPSGYPWWFSPPRMRTGIDWKATTFEPTVTFANRSPFDEFMEAVHQLGLYWTDWMRPREDRPTDRRPWAGKTGLQIARSALGAAAQAPPNRKVPRLNRSTRRKDRLPDRLPSTAGYPSAKAFHRRYGLPLLLSGRANHQPSTPARRGPSSRKGSSLSQAAASGFRDKAASAGGSGSVNRYFIMG